MTVGFYKKHKGDSVHWNEDDKVIQVVRPLRHVIELHVVSIVIRRSSLLTCWRNLTPHIPTAACGKRHTCEKLSEYLTSRAVNELPSEKSKISLIRHSNMSSLFQMLHREQDLYVQTVCATLRMLHGPGVGMCIWSIGLSGNLRLHAVRVHVWFLDLLRQRHLWSLFSVPRWTYS